MPRTQPSHAVHHSATRHHSFFPIAFLYPLKGFVFPARLFDSVDSPERSYSLSFSIAMATQNQALATEALVQALHKMFGVEIAICRRVVERVHGDEGRAVEDGKGGGEGQRWSVG